MIPLEAVPIIGNLFHSIKIICQKVLPNLPISGNVRFQEPWEEEDELERKNETYVTEMLAGKSEDQIKKEMNNF